jgi:hypothetical protein
MSTKDKNRICQHVDERGKPCKRAIAPDSTMCRQHTPGYAEDLRKRAQARFEEQLVEHNAQMLLKSTEASDELIRIKHALRAWDNALEDRKKEVASARLLLSQVATIERLEEIYQTAKASGDAATMHAVNKSMYYAKKKAKGN